MDRERTEERPLNLRTWIAFVLLETVMCLAPGPAVLTVFGCALDAGWRGGVASTFGILASNGVYFVISAAGLGTLLLGFPRVFTTLQWIGAAYLLWLGTRMMVHGRTGGPAAALIPTRGSARYFGRAVMVQITNPKALVFFSALLPQFLDPHRDPLRQLWILGLTGGIVELLVLLGYTALAVSGQRRFPGGKFSLTSRRLAGAWLVVIGVALVLARLR